MNNVTTGVAVGGASAPLWAWDLALQGASMFTVAIPWLSGIWLILNLGWFVYSKWKLFKNGMV